MPPADEGADVLAWRKLLLKKGLLLPGTFQPPSLGLPQVTNPRASPAKAGTRVTTVQEEEMQSPRASSAPARSRTNSVASAAIGVGTLTSSNAGSLSNSSSSSGRAAGPVPVRPAAECGVSLAYLQHLVDTLGLASDDITSIVHDLISPLTRSFTCRGPFWDLIPPKYVAPPDYYIIHAWGASLTETVDQLYRNLVPEDSKTDPAQVFVWLDSVSLCQNSPPGSPHEVNMSRVTSIITSCETGVVVVVDPNNVVLTRIWCVYEVWLAIRFGDSARLRVAFPEHFGIEEVWQFEQACLRLDLTFCFSSRPEDKAQIMQVIKHSVGVKLVTKQLSEALVRSFRSALRFSSHLEDVAMYCALLLKGGEYCRCQQVLSLIEQLDDDEKMLEDVRNIFQMYDSDGSGELDMQEFIEVLKTTGFEDTEAMTMYQEVDADGGGSVSLEEFEEWFRATQRQQGNRLRRRLVMTGEGLVDNLDKMVLLMHRNDLKEYEDFFSSYLQRMRSGRLFKLSQPLTAAPLKGDWQNMTDECMWNLHLREYAPAAHKLYNLLMWNSDSLDYHPLEVPRLSKAKGQGQGQQRRTAVKPTLLLYMQLFASILMHQPGRRMHAEYFTSYVEELKKEQSKEEVRHATRNPDGSSPSPEDQGREQSAEEVVAAARKRAKSRDVRSVQYERTKFSIVRNMISMKYGKGQPVSRPLICEAEMSIGQWMANNRRDTERGRGQGTGSLQGGVGSLASSYFGAVGVQTLLPSTTDKSWRQNMEVNMETVMLGASGKEQSSSNTTTKQDTKAAEEFARQQQSIAALADTRAVGGGMVVNRIATISRRERARERSVAAAGAAHQPEEEADEQGREEREEEEAGSRGRSRSGRESFEVAPGQGRHVSISPLPPAVSALPPGLEPETSALSLPNLSPKATGPLGFSRSSWPEPADGGSPLTSPSAAGEGEAGPGPGTSPGEQHPSPHPCLPSVLSKLSRQPGGVRSSASFPTSSSSSTWRPPGGAAARQPWEDVPSVRRMGRSSVVDELFSKVMPFSPRNSPTCRQPPGHGTSLGNILMARTWDLAGEPGFCASPKTSPSSSPSHAKLLTRLSCPNIGSKPAKQQSQGQGQGQGQSQGQGQGQGQGQVHAAHAQTRMQPGRSK